MITKEDWEDKLRLSKEDYAKGEDNLKEITIAMMIIKKNIEFISSEIKRITFLDDEKKAFESEKK